MKFAVKVSDFCLWSPSIQGELPSVSFLPLALRKKLSPLTKVACYLLNQIVEKNSLEAETLRLVLASRFGEADNTIQLLRAIRDDEPTSPMAFSRSVHNSAIGIYSIATKNKMLSSTVAGGTKSVSAGLIEASVQLYSGNEVEQAVLVFVDERMPDEYHQYVSSPVEPYGFVCLLEKAEQNLTIEFRQGEDEGTEFIRFLLNL